jgi:hypothetical protein
MGDMKEVFDAMDEDRKQKRLVEAEESLSTLKEEGVPHRICNALNWHVLVDEKVDFWPSTGKWRVRGSGRTGRGVRALLGWWRKKSES